MYYINCLLEGDPVAFTVEIDEPRNVSSLKKEIKKDKAVTLADVDADDLTLYHVNLKYVNSDEQARITQVKEALKGSEPLRPLRKLSNIKDGFPEDEDLVHIIVQLPPSESIDSRACDVRR
jgi:hypothetical protein